MQAERLNLAMTLIDPPQVGDNFDVVGLREHVEAFNADDLVTGVNEGADVSR
jgi:hypothetical protein